MAQRHCCECESNKWKILISHWTVSRQNFTFDALPPPVSMKWKREGEFQNDLNVKMLRLFHLKSEIAIRLEKNLYLWLAFAESAHGLVRSGCRGPSVRPSSCHWQKINLYGELHTIFHQFVYFWDETCSNICRLIKNCCKAVCIHVRSSANAVDASIFANLKLREKPLIRH